MSPTLTHPAYRVGMELLLDREVGQLVRGRVRQLGDAARAGRRHEDPVVRRNGLMPPGWLP